MKLAQLSYVAAVAERGSLRAAARHLGVAQPAFSRSIAELERELGAPLFERRPKGMVATPLGRLSSGAPRRSSTTSRRAKDEFEQLRGNAVGSVTIGLSIAAHLQLLPKTLRSFRSQYPKVHLHIIEGFYPTLAPGLQDGSVDFYIGPDPGLRLPSTLRKKVAVVRRTTVLCRVQHPLARRHRSRTCATRNGSPPRSRRRPKTKSATCSSATACPSRNWRCKANRR